MFVFGANTVGQGRHIGARSQWSRSVLGASTPAIWVTADSVAAADGALETWPALVGDDPTQPTVSKRPDYGLQSWSRGGPAVTYDAVGEAHALSTLDLSSYDSATIGIAYEVTATGATRILFLYGGSLTYNGDTLHYGVGSGDVGYSVVGDPVTADHIEVTDDALAGAPRCTVIVVDRAAAAANQVKFYNMTGAMGQSTSVSVDVSGNFGAAGNCWIGAENNGGSGAADAVVREVVVWPLAMTAEQATSMARALAHRAKVVAP